MDKPNKNFLVGCTFGRLIVVKRLPNKVPFGWYEAPDDMPSLVPYTYECDCACGKKGIVVKEYDLIKGRKKSCGCWRKEVRKAYWKRQQKRAIDRREVGKAILAALKKENQP